MVNCSQAQVVRYRISDELLIPLLPETKDTTNSTIKIKNNTLAMDAAPAAMPKNPNIPAIIATTRKIIVQRNIGFNLIKFKNLC
jgi:hypothetical protein